MQVLAELFAICPVDFFHTIRKLVRSGVQHCISQSFWIEEKKCNYPNMTDIGVYGEEVCYLSVGKVLAITMDAKCICE